MRSRILTALAALCIAVAAPVVLAGCGEAKVTREEAAGCEASLRVLADRENAKYDQPLDEWELEDPRSIQLYQSIEDAESTVRAKCNERIFGVARSALPDGGGAIKPLSTICEADPYRETILCGSLPQE